MTDVGVHQAKTHFSKILRRVMAGEEIVITRGGKPIAKLVSVTDRVQRVLGRDHGLFEVPEEFDSPLPDGVLAGFE
jgi:prevent-host-death family protein